MTRSSGKGPPKRKKQTEVNDARRDATLPPATKPAGPGNGGGERTVTLRAPATKSTKRRDEGEERITRRWIEEALLAERLGLNDDWIDQWDEGDGLREESRAPSEIPPFIRAKIERGVTSGRKIASRYERDEVKTNVDEGMAAVDAAIEQLVAGGCRKPVIYFCLEELSPESEKRRFQGKPGAGSEDSRRGGPSPAEGDLPGLPTPPVRRKLAPREKLRELPVAARRTRRLVHAFDEELLLVAHAVERFRSVRRQLRLARATRESRNPPAAEPEGGMSIDLPQGILTTIDIPEEALALLESLLLWAARLSKAYTAPFEQRVLQSKGFLFLTASVTEHAKLSGSQYDAHGGEEHPLSVLASLAGGKDWPPSYLKDKLLKFKADHPDLYSSLMDKLRELHDFHADR